MSTLYNTIIETLKTVHDPDLHKNIVDLGFVKNLEIQNGKVSFTLELTTPACPVKDLLQNECIDKLKNIDGVNEVKVNMTAQVRSASKQHPILEQVKNVIAVASGKGGVGKSTVATNLAVSLSLAGAAVGLMDADIYGPSIPQMIGLPIVPPTGEDHFIIPFEKYGMKVISAAFFTKPGQPFVMRGPMLAGIIQQFLENVAWGALDYLVIDMPPGTGDVQLTLCQKAPLSGAVIVTTPQQVSLIDAEKGVKMFQQVKVPILGIVENMSYFICDNCNKQHNIFKRGGGKSLAETFHVPFLGEIPLVEQVVIGGDEGIPIVCSNKNSPAAIAYKNLSEQVASQLSILHAESGAIDSNFEMKW